MSVERRCADSLNSCEIAREQTTGRGRTWSAVIRDGKPERRCRVRPAGLQARYLRGRGLKAESGLVVFRKMPLPREGVEFDAPATFCTGSASEREAARVGAKLMNFYSATQAPSAALCVPIRCRFISAAVSTTAPRTTSGRGVHTHERSIPAPDRQRSAIPLR
jgi:hypothetical protein